MKRVFQAGRWQGIARGAPVLALVLAGCAGVPDAPHAGLPPVASAEAALRARAAEAALAEDAVPAQWWQLFNDATLAALEAEAAASNMDLQGALLRIEESRAQLGLADAARRPQVGASAGYARQALSENEPMALLGAPTRPADAWSLGVQASWELDLWGHLRQQSAAAQARLQAAGYGMQAVQVSVAGDVARAYLLLRGVQAQERIAAAHRQMAQRLLHLAESRARHGVATRSDVAAARADLARTEARLLQWQNQREAALNALALLLGQPPRALDARLAVDTAADSVADLPPMPRRLPIGIPSELARQRPDILQAEARLRAAVADMGAAQADFYPRISLSGSVGVQAFALSDLGSWDSRRFSIGPSLYLPVFQGGRLERNLALGEARHRLAALAYQQTVLRAWHEVDNALGAHAAEARRHAQLQQALAQGRAALFIAERGYQEGTADFTAVLVARRALLSSQSELADCATASALSVVALYRALGGGWSPALQNPSL